MALLKIPDAIPQSQPVLEDRGDPALPGILHRTYWLFLNAIRTVLGAMASAVSTLQAQAADLLGRDYVYGGTNLSNVGAIPKVSAAETVTESAITDNGTLVTILGRPMTLGSANQLVSALLTLHYGTDKNLVVADKVLLSTGVTIRAVNDAASANVGLELRADPLLLGSDPAKPVGFFGATPVVQQALAAYASNSQGSAYAGISNLVAGNVYAQVVDLNALRVAYQNLLASHDDLRTKLQTTTLVT